MKTLRITVRSIDDYGHAWVADIEGSDIYHGGGNSPAEAVECLQLRMMLTGFKAAAEKIKYKHG